MADLLVKHLKRKAEKHSALRSLYSQWDFDEKLIPKALQTIGSLFPHYSRHDESHSKQILVNIERLLGKNIKLLTATDTWLLLESAYWHDIGMVVPYEDLEKAVNDDDFKVYVQSICAQPNHELYSLASAFTTKSHPTLIFEGNAPLEMASKLREFMAEWFRRKHPSRAEQIVRAPAGTVGISSPRTELIPARLFRLLGRICQMHGAPFRELIAEGGLPFREAGLAQDDCHPRFIACLLRMGDLLDMDDNRFCPVMQRIAGDNRSKVSKAHEDKHAGVRHLRIDQERIEVVAECETIEGYIESFRWFDWLKQEVQDQRAHWRDIVPNRKLGLLPMLGPVSVRLGGGIQILKDGERPAFSIDEKKAIELLQGNNLYENRFACVRELLQNSVDATLLRIWLTNRKVYDPEFWETPNEEKIKKLLKGSSIYVSLKEVNNIESEAPKKSSWVFTVQDEGTGISREDLEYMLKIGSSQRNDTRHKIINQMPEWMKPSGNFGIGLQSVFMICDKINISTKSIITNEIFDITMYSPTGPKEGLVILKRLDDDISRSIGTTFSFTFELDTFAQSWSYEYQGTDSIASRIVDNLDPLLDSSFPYEAAKLSDQISRFGEHSLVPVRGKMNTILHEYKINDTDEILEESLEWRFIKIGTTEARFWFEPSIDIHPANSTFTFYRGQRFDTNDIYFPNVTIVIDLMSGKAGNWLNFNRDKASPTAGPLIEKAMLSCLQYAVQEDLKDQKNCELLNGEEKRATYSHFLKSMALVWGGDWVELANRLGDSWLDSAFEKNGIRYRELFSLQDWKIGIKQSDYETDEANYNLVLEAGRFGQTLDIILSEWSKIADNTIKITGSSLVIEPTPTTLEKTATQGERIKFDQIQRSKLRNHYILKKGPQDLWDKNALATELAQAMKLPHGNRRYLLCVKELFTSITLKPSTKLMAKKIFPRLFFNNDYILIPLLFLGKANAEGRTVESTPEQIEALCRWTQDKLNHHNTIDEIRKTYNEIILFIDNEIMRPTRYWEQWKRARRIE
ncbi:ATP-binding protein [Pseudomonas viridiflava]|uniref:HD domain-containing protein n=1 Tax=Pseudomonas viridiflava TaxID=33069 RepID=UPI002E9D822E|nr:ATP-binding protein [Pseudomonas viridiflava]